MPKPTVLILDDDPVHLKIYGWIVDRGDFRAVTALAKDGAADLPIGQHVDIVPRLSPWWLGYCQRFLAPDPQGFPCRSHRDPFRARVDAGGIEG